MAEHGELPPGFRFAPTDAELLYHYLTAKSASPRGGSLSHLRYIAELNIYSHEPWDLPDRSVLQSGDTQWFFFSPCSQNRLYNRKTNRATAFGYWKATGKDRKIRRRLKTIGTKKTLVYYRGHAPRGERTDWVMHEYRLDEEYAKWKKLLSEYVLCKVFHKGGIGPRNGEQYGAPIPIEEEDDDNDDDAIATCQNSENHSNDGLSKESTSPIEGKEEEEEEEEKEEEERGNPKGLQVSVNGEADNGLSELLTYLVEEKDGGSNNGHGNAIHASGLLLEDASILDQILVESELTAVSYHHRLPPPLDVPFSNPLAVLFNGGDFFELADLDEYNLPQLWAPLSQQGGFNEASTTEVNFTTRVNSATEVNFTTEFNSAPKVNSTTEVGFTTEVNSVIKGNSASKVNSATDFNFTTEFNSANKVKSAAEVNSATDFYFTTEFNSATKVNTATEVNSAADFNFTNEFNLATEVNSAADFNFNTEVNSPADFSFNTEVNSAADFSFSTEINSATEVCGAQLLPWASSYSEVRIFSCGVKRRRRRRVDDCRERELRRAFDGIHTNNLKDSSALSNTGNMLLLLITQLSWPRYYFSRGLLPCKDTTTATIITTSSTAGNEEVDTEECIVALSMVLGQKESSSPPRLPLIYYSIFGLHILFYLIPLYRFCQYPTADGDYFWLFTLFINLHASVWLFKISLSLSLSLSISFCLSHCPMFFFG